MTTAVRIKRGFTRIHMNVPVSVHDGQIADVIGTIPAIPNVRPELTRIRVPNKIGGMSIVDTQTTNTEEVL